MNLLISIDLCFYFIFMFNISFDLNACGYLAIFA